MVKNLVRGMRYIVTVGETCEVTDANGKPVATVEPGVQTEIMASTAQLTFSTEAVDIKRASF